MYYCPSAMKPFLLLLLPLALLVGACASASGPAAPSYNAHAFNTQELEAAHSTVDVYTLIQSRRPLWLKRRGRQSVLAPGDIVVYVDRLRYEGPGVLRSLAVRDVVSLVYLPPSRAQAYYGLGHPHGAIVVETL